ncbi:DNA primase [Porphyromonas sp. COT-239 OH1446]|uniref:DNA primase n=1 Tax=Porphyromonas sp. COT-239 OH1446 TaxID=1515613 RepID=UPI00052DFEBB|nr:DNA primase [Porphyromonas sp. COT-239 OH1446]KGN71275.1 DNA primase [Porphyromonas sp. COT-239 OH1446]
MIDSQTKQHILDTANILEVVQDFVRLRKRGVSYVGLCPFHSDRNPSFYVNPARNICKCFSCGEGGSPVHFIMKHEQMDYNEALRYLAKKYNIEIRERELTDEERRMASERQSLLIINEYAQSFFVDQLHNSPEGQRVALEYFRERGIRPETIKKFGLGYSPEERSALTDAALAAGYKLERLMGVGLSLQYDEGRPAVDRFRGRVIFPVRNLAGKYVAFGGRIMGQRDKVAKYINSPESPIYSKGRELYGIYWAKSAISRQDKCYLVEGYTDVISMHQCGIENVVSSSGTALTIPQIRLLKRFTSQITVLYDGDSAGIKAALRGIDLLLEEGLNIKVVLLPEGHDPDSYAQSHTAEEFLRFLNEAETDFIHFKIRLYQEEMERDPIKRAQLISDILRSIALIPDTIRRTVLIQSSAGELKMDERILMDEIRRLRQSGIHASGYYQPEPQSAASPTPSPLPQSEARVEVAPEPEASSSQEVRELLPTPRSAAPYEIELLRLLISKGGETILIYDEELAHQEPETQGLISYTLTEYIAGELELDGVLDLLTPLMSQILSEALEDCLPRQLSCATYFSNHAEEDIRRLSADLLSDRYADDRVGEPLGIEAWEHETDPEQREVLRLEYLHRQLLEEQRGLGEEVLRALDYMRISFVLQTIREVQQEIREAQRQGDSRRITELMLELKELNEQKKDFAHALGERTIIG